MNNDELIEKVKSKVNNKYIAENDVQFVFCKNLIFNYSDKYEIIDALNDVDLPIITVDTSSITLPGYVGKSLSDELSFLLKKTNGYLELAQRGIVILDEFNRIAVNDINIFVDKNMSNYDQEISTLRQTRRLCLLQSLFTSCFDGETIPVLYNGKEYNFDTSYLTFICLGNYKNIDGTDFSFNSFIDEGYDARMARYFDFMNYHKKRNKEDNKTHTK